MDEGVLDSVESDLFRVLWTYELSDALTIKETLLSALVASLPRVDFNSTVCQLC